MRDAKILLTVMMAAMFMNTAAFAEKLSVVATNFPLYDMVREIGRDRVEVRKLLPSGVEAHSFEPTPKDVVAVNKCGVFLYTGRAMEPWAADIADGVVNKSLVVVDVSQGISVAEDGDPHHAGHDPHIWLDLGYAQTMTDTIAAAFAAKDPANQDLYLANAAAFKKRLADLDARFAATLATCTVRTIVHAGHFAFGLFARRYHLDYVSPYRGFAPDAEPSPRNIKELIDTLKAGGAKVIYYEELIDPKVARVIAFEAGVEMKLLSGAHNITADQMAKGATFLSIMEENLVNLRKGLQCR